MNGNKLSEALRFGGPVYGTLVASPSPRWPSVLSNSGLDFVFIDTEHIALDRETLSWMCQAYRQMDLAPIVRIPEPRGALASMVLDGGATGIVAPYVETAAEVRQLVGAVKHRPLKGKRLEQLLHGSTLEEPLKSYMDENNQQHVLIVNVESAPAIDAINEIVSVPGLDGVLIGPHDLSCSLGIPEQYQHPRFESAVRHIIQTARSVQVGVGIHFWGDLCQEIAWLREGMNMLVHSGDILLFAKHLRLELEYVKSAIESNVADGGGNPLHCPAPHLPSSAFV